MSADSPVGKLQRPAAASAAASLSPASPHAEASNDRESSDQPASPGTIRRTVTPGDDAFGIVIFRTDDDEAARQVVDEDPAVAAGVMRAELFPFRLAMLSRDWKAPD